MMSWIVWFRGANASIYSCHFLASWSGRMWAFSMGLFLISVSPESLQLSATYGLSMGATVLILGTILGDWVDRTPRLKAAIVSMICQNVLIGTCACVVLVLLLLLSETAGIADWLRHLLYAIIISLSVSSRLMREARIIVVERDWIVEICSKDEHQLAVMTSSFRRLDLLTKLLAPIVTGQIMTFAGLKVGCGFIAVWSLISLCVEYYLIRRVYTIVPSLKIVKCKEDFAVVYDHAVEPASEEGQFLDPNSKTIARTEHNQINDIEAMETAYKRSSSGQCFLWNFLSSFLILYRGIKIYFSCVTKWPGLALACLYLTVLGFDDITVGYATMQGLTGSILGVMMGVGAGFGILATFTYPYIVKKLGLPMTGVLALGLQVSCLTLCVISVWLPGSPFDLFLNNIIQGTNGTLRNCSTGMCTLTTVCQGLQNNTLIDSVEFNTDVGMTYFTENITSCVDDVPQAVSDSSLSVWVMIAGIVLARFGLWTADLTTVQLFLENVPPIQRGKVNGFQTSLNQLMDFLKYSLVVIIPHPHQFGILVFISFASICTGWAFMCVNAVKAAKRRD